MYWSVSLFNIVIYAKFFYEMAIRSDICVLLL